MVSSSELWEVVGGASKGGLIVRTGKDTTSAELPGRLATGALVWALYYDAGLERIFYKKVSGSGPETGWVSTTVKGKELVVKSAHEVSEKEAAEVCADSPELVMQLYCQRFGKADDGEQTDFRQNRQAFAWQTDGFVDKLLPEAEVRAELEKDLSLAGPFARANAHQAVDSRVILCVHCRLPVGDKAYTKDGGKTMLHGECLAQQLLREIKDDDQAKEQQQLKAKRERREEFDIGWKVEQIPAVERIASRLGSPVAKGMCCLVLQEDNTVRLAPTVEPAAAVNLEYLAVALQVRRRDNREPLFSLDPIDTVNLKESMQVKRFEPAWLAGTSVGEILFQADYHLKELSMGEYEQPVAGMRNCYDLSDDSVQEEKWHAREWFIVRKAEVQMSDDLVLMPHVKMGVEAREQVVGANGLEDVRATKPHHPLVQYADAFTHNFDLIAERKSVVFHLRELAKASVMAKFLVEADVRLDPSWFVAAEDLKEACCLEIPQLWNERERKEIRMQDGLILNADGFGMSCHRLYGGVQFGLDKFQLAGARQPARMLSAGLAARQFVQPARHLSSTLSAGLATRQFQRSFGPLGVQPSRVSAGVGLDKFGLSGARQPSRMLSAGLAARQFVQPARHLSATLSAGLATRQFQRSFGPLGVQPSRVAGVDLNLDEFNLSATTPAEPREGGSALRADAGVDISATFWSSIQDETASMFSREDKSLLRSVFNPSLSDRREEGERFMPPDTSSSYVQSLRALVKEEESVRRQRKQHFCSTRFVADSPGPLFPASWRATVEISHQETGAKQAGPALHPRLDYKAQTLVFEQALQKAVPVFNKSTEDGTSYRVYRFGTLEVRTTQDVDSEEAIGAVFSHCASADASNHHQLVREDEKIVKATEYVEASGKDYHIYVVLETDRHNLVVTEELKNGTVRREANPKDLEDRNSLAKILRSADCGKFGFTVGGVKALQSDIYKHVSGRSEPCLRRK